MAAAIFYCFPRYISRKLGWRWSSWDSFLWSVGFALSSLAYCSHCTKMLSPYPPPCLCTPHPLGCCFADNIWDYCLVRMPISGFVPRDGCELHRIPYRSVILWIKAIYTPRGQICSGQSFRAVSPRCVLASGWYLPHQPCTQGPAEEGSAARAPQGE